MTPSSNAFTSLPDKVGQELGVSDWVTVDQAMIDAFGKATLDPDPMHVDPEWAAQYSPFGTTIAFGFLTVGLLTYFSHQALGWIHDNNPDGGGYGLNYGFDKLRLVAPVPVNSRIRGRFTLVSCAEGRPGELKSKFGVTVEIEGASRPALVAEWLSVWISGSEAHQRLQQTER